jgi:hypothetical protein
MLCTHDLELFGHGIVQLLMLFKVFGNVVLAGYRFSVAGPLLHLGSFL